MHDEIQVNMLLIQIFLVLHEQFYFFGTLIN